MTLYATAVSVHVLAAILGLARVTAMAVVGSSADAGVGYHLHWARCDRRSTARRG